MSVAEAHTARMENERGVPSKPMEVRLAFAGLLLFTALLPVQVWIQMPGSGASTAVSPADLALAVSLPAFAIALLRGKTRVELGPFSLAVIAYVGCVLVAVATSESLARSAIRSANLLACAAAALLAAHLVRTEEALRKMLQAWMLGAAFTAALGLATIALFYAGAAPGLVNSLTSDFGSLPVGNYPRVAALFARQPNTLCHYLSISLFVVGGAATVGWINRLWAAVLVAGALIVCAFTVSLGMGAIALGLGWWLAWNPALTLSVPLRRTALALGILAAVVFAILMVVAPASDHDAGVRLPFFSFRAEPSARVVCWEAAWTQFTQHPFLGRGVGVQPTCPAYVVASGVTARLTDAHNMYLSVASTQGFLGLAGLGLVLGTVLRRTIPLPRQASTTALLAGTLAIAVMQAWLYQGLAGSFEFTRHGWLALGLLWVVRGGEIDHTP